MERPRYACRLGNGILRTQKTPSTCSMPVYGQRCVWADDRRGGPAQWKKDKGLDRLRAHGGNPQQIQEFCSGVSVVFMSGMACVFPQARHAIDKVGAMKRIHGAAGRRWVEDALSRPRPFARREFSAALFEQGQRDMGGWRGPSRRRFPG